MDTNSLIQMAKDLEELRGIVARSVPMQAGGGGNTLQIVSVIVLALTGILSATASWISKQAATESKAAAIEAGSNIEASRLKTEVVVSEIAKVHSLVNNRSTESVQEIKNLNLKNEEMVKMLATLQEKISTLLAEREQASKIAIALATPVPVTPHVTDPPAHSDSSDQVALLKRIVSELEQYKTTLGTPASAESGQPALRIAAPPSLPLPGD